MEDAALQETCQKFRLPSSLNHTHLSTHWCDRIKGIKLISGTLPKDNDRTRDNEGEIKGWDTIRDSKEQQKNERKPSQFSDHAVDENKGQ
jgi:hypothetical protein